MSEPLGVVFGGAVTAAGLSLPAACAAARAGISAYEESDFLLASAGWEPIIAAVVPMRPKPTEAPLFGRLVELARLAIEECLSGTDLEPRAAALLLGVREPHRMAHLDHWTDADLLSEVQRKVGVRFHAESRVLPYGNASAAVGLLEARRLLSHGTTRWCLVGGVD